MSNYRELMQQGLWRNNPGLVQLLGLCPLLATSSSLTNAIGLGLATMLVLASTNLMISLVRNQVPAEIRIPVFVMIIAAVVTAIETTYACLHLRPLSITWHFHPFDCH